MASVYNRDLSRPLVINVRSNYAQKRESMRVIFVVCSLLMPSLASAQFSQSFEKCSAVTQTQLDVNNCAGTELQRVKSELDARYAKLRAEIGGDKLGLKKLASMQTAWVGYRDSYLEAMYPADNKMEQYGTIYPSAISLAEARLTLQQIVAIEAILELYKPR
jgi:uncharacterized protein YecT (DUF1311 family)